MTNHEDTNSFDFDYWMELAKTNPDEFEKQRQYQISALLEQAPEQSQARLKGLQWRIDQEIKMAKNPMDSCLKIHDMMIDSVFGSNGLVEAITNNPDSKEMQTINKVDSKIVDLASFAIEKAHQSNRSSGL